MGTKLISSNQFFFKCFASLHGKEMIFLRQENIHVLTCQTFFYQLLTEKYLPYYSTMLTADLVETGTQKKYCSLIFSLFQ